MGWARAQAGAAGGGVLGAQGGGGSPGPGRARPGASPCKGYVSCMDIYIYVYIYYPILSYVILYYPVLSYMILYNPNRFLIFLFTLLGSRACLGGWI